jgi:poly-gamma-glutamate synthesis protein (capsule biosynthesis protein)
MLSKIVSGAGMVRGKLITPGKMASLLMLAVLLLAACGAGAVSTPEETLAFPTPRPTRTGGPQESVTLALGGDVMLARYVNAAVHSRGAHYLWGDVLPLLREADLSLVNLECTIAEGGEPFAPERVFYFRADPEAIEALAVAGIDYVTLSNNHAMDFQGAALLETIRHLDERGIAHAGAGSDAEGASQPALLTARGITVGVVAFADHFEEYAATESGPGTNILPVTVDEEHFHRVRESIEAVRAAGADLVVFSIHWGPNLRLVPSQDFRDFAHAVMDAGVDIFHGHSAHVPQGIEIYRGKPIFYDTGDLIDDYYVYEEYRNDLQLLFLVTASADYVERVELFPLLIYDAQVNRATGKAFEQIQGRIGRLSAAMGTEIRREDDRLVVDLPGR